MKKCYFALLVICAFWVSCSSSSVEGEPPTPPVKGDFRLHAYLQNGMVIQQNQPLRLWGRGTPGIELTASGSWASTKVTCVASKEGLWEVALPVAAAPSDNAPQSITVASSQKTVSLSDLLIGEVWLLGGQSNMDFKMSQVLNHAAEIAAADHPQIRFFSMYPTDADRPEWEWRLDRPQSYYTWRKCSPSSAADMSAVGYYFGQMLHRELGVPVGLINTSNGGATAQAYTPISALRDNPALKTTFVDSATPGMNPLQRPAALYNAMVAPILGASIRGVAWYQGEGNWGDYDIYPLLMKTLMTAWRQNFRCGTVPFYCVQIAPWAMGTDVSQPAMFYAQQYPYFLLREAQTKIRNEVAATGMAVTMDVGDANDIHPINKRPVGERLARLALNQTYGRSEVKCLGPRYKSLKVEASVVKIAFDNAEGLMTRDAQAPVHFYVAAATGAQHRFHATVATIHGSEVWLSCPEVVTATTTARDIQVRYAMLIAPTTNLQNGAGLPAEPFRTDTWSEGVSYVY
ncbi:MAG: sialate O-acetylesterase [Alistipes sp.]